MKRTSGARGRGVRSQKTSERNGLISIVLNKVAQRPGCSEWLAGLTDFWLDV